MIYTVKFKKSDQFSIEVRKKNSWQFLKQFSKVTDIMHCMEIDKADRMATAL